MKKPKIKNDDELRIHNVGLCGFNDFGMLLADTYVEPTIDGMPLLQALIEHEHLVVTGPGKKTLLKWVGFQYGRREARVEWREALGEGIPYLDLEKGIVKYGDRSVLIGDGSFQNSQIDPFSNEQIDQLIHRFFRYNLTPSIRQVAIENEFRIHYRCYASKVNTPELINIMVHWCDGRGHRLRMH